MNDEIRRMYQEGTSTEYDAEDGLLSSVDDNPSLNKPRSERVATGMRSASRARVTSVDVTDIPVSSSRPRTSSGQSPRQSSASGTAPRQRPSTGAPVRQRPSSGAPARQRPSDQQRPSSGRSSGHTRSSAEGSEVVASSSKSYSEVLEAKHRSSGSSSAPKKRPASQQKKSSGKKAKSKKNRKKGIGGFGKFLIIYSAILLIGVIVTSLVLNSFLKKFEENQPANVAADVVKQFETPEKLRAFLDENSSIVNQSTAILNYEDAFINSVQGKKISFIEDPSRSTSELTSYRLTADNMPVATIDLKKGEKGTFGLSPWVLSSIDTSKAFTDVKTYSILVPEASKVIVNGTELGESMISGTGVPEVLRTSSQFIASPPTYSTYNVKVVGDAIDVSGTDATGANLVFSQTENSFVAGGQASQEFIDSVKDRVEAGLRSYALWFIYNSFDLEDYIVDGCELAAFLFGGEFDGETYDPINPWLYNFEYIDDFEFSKFEAKNYTKYSDDCFTVDISYKLDITFTDPSYSDDNQKLDATWVWVKQGDTWYISSSKTY